MALTDELAQAGMRKKEFSKQRERIIPWSEWIGIIKPHYYRGECGNKPYPLETAGAVRFGGYVRDKRSHRQPGSEDTM